MPGYRPAAVPIRDVTWPARPAHVIGEGLVIRETGAALLDPPTAAFDRLKVCSTRAPPTRWRTTRDYPPLLLVRACWGSGRDHRGQMFAYRATRPADLAWCPDPVGELNDEFTPRRSPGPAMVIAAWGTYGTPHGRAAHLTRMLTAAGIPAWCLGTTRSGQPVRPLYRPADADLVSCQGPTALEGPPGNTTRPAIRCPGRMRGYRREAGSPASVPGRASAPFFAASVPLRPRIGDGGAAAIRAGSGLLPAAQLEGHRRILLPGIPGIPCGGSSFLAQGFRLSVM